MSAPRPCTARSAYPRRNASSEGTGASRYRFGITRSGRSYRRWNPSRPATTTSPAANRCSSARLAGFQFHISPGLAPLPSNAREGSAPRSRIASRTSASVFLSSRLRPHQWRSLSSSIRRLNRGSPRSAAGRPRGPSTRRSAASRKQPRDGARRVAAEPRGERQAVRAVDRRDRVQLHAAEPANVAATSGGA